MHPDSILQKQKRLWSEIENRLKHGKIEFPLMPFVALRLMEIAQDPDSSAQDLQKVIIADQVIASRVLRIANSPLFPCREPVVSLQHAIIRLGYRNIFNMVLASSLYTNIVGANSYSNKSHQLWEHSLGCAMMCRVIAATVNEDAEEAFTIGLLHDFGKLLLYQETIIQSYNFGETPEEFEDFVKAYHSVLGGILTQSWNLPSRVSEAIRFHHDPEKAVEAKRMTAIVCFGNLLCHYHGIGVEPENIEIHGSASAKILGMQSFKVDALLEVALEAFKITSEIFPMNKVQN
ncbi:MAG: hypothetical protein A2161_12215 [Candidatus Schekmanbacteria bacterium RBG_13_48_7]|uniref:Uncharacterized protein n=1 Tax=Candidatus Schekmanbacteria bacterium RBG_13_48_7 TaxID=1817878 RepID=A0A1F7RJ64_9BACT|nr:MAG: hypothetical protein A2161_12215 [Candidatus Schekmanbacteria bacterium RBG_13_48_7]